MSNNVNLLSRNYYEITLIILSLFILILFLGTHPIIILDESKNAEAAREFIVTGQYMIPYFNGEIREYEQEIRDIDLEVASLQRDLMTGRSIAPSLTRAQINELHERREVLLFGTAVKEADIERILSEISDLMSQIQEIDARISVLEEIL